MHCYASQVNLSNRMKQQSSIWMHRIFWKLLMISKCKDVPNKHQTTRDISRSALQLWRETEMFGDKLRNYIGHFTHTKHLMCKFPGYFVDYIWFSYSNNSLLVPYKISQNFPMPQSCSRRDILNPKSKCLSRTRPICSWTIMVSTADECTV